MAVIDDSSIGKLAAWGAKRRAHSVCFPLGPTDHHWSKVEKRSVRLFMERNFGVIKNPSHFFVVVRKTDGNELQWFAGRHVKHFGNVICNY